MMPMAKTKLAQNGRPMTRPMTKNTTPSATESTATTRLTNAISRWRGNAISRVVWVRWAILPNSVCMPVAKTTARASPETTVVPARTTLVLCSASSQRQGAASRTSRDRLAGDRGVVDPHRERLDHAAIGGDEVARLQRDHVAGDQVGGGPLLENPVAQHPDLVRQQLLQGRSALSAR